MIIENPERLGLRSCTSYVAAWAVARWLLTACALQNAALQNRANPPAGTTRRNDGFVIAQKDLEIRGPGEL